MSPAALGKEARSRVPRSSHKGWERAATGPDPVAVLAEQAKTRDPALIPLRHQRMLESPFTFYRGAAAVMAADLAATPDSGIHTQLCGDAHLSNFGGFASPDRSLVFDINDFDETHPGPWEWDLKRLLASIEIAGRSRGEGAKTRSATVAAASAEYRKAMRRFASMTNLEVFAERLDIVDLIKRWGQVASKRDQARTRKVVRKGLSKDSMRALSKLTKRVDGELRIVSDPPLITPIEEFMPPEQLANGDEMIQKLLGEYAATLHGAAAELLSHYSYVHLARKVVGVGSVGTRALIVLMRGSDDDSDPLFLQVKEAQPSVLESFTSKSRYRRHGRRVVEGQWRMQAAGDIFLGWLTAKGVDGVSRDFYLRQLWDWKTSADVDAMTPRALRAYGRACAWTLARAHARTGDRFAVAAYVGKGESLDRAMTDFAARYADQNEKDHQALADAVASGRLEASTEQGDAR